MVAQRTAHGHRRDVTLLAVCSAVLLLVSGIGLSPASAPSTGIPQSDHLPTWPGSSPRGAGEPAASPPVRLSYPTAGLDVQVHPLEPGPHAIASRSLVPPQTTDGYWLAPYGSPGAGSTNTTYIVGHSWVGQDAPFNHLSTAATPGDTLTVVTATGSVDYRVDAVSTYSKSTLRDSDIWNIVPNRLVLISCHSDDPWGRNVVVTALPAAGTFSAAVPARPEG